MPSLPDLMKGEEDGVGGAHGGVDYASISIYLLLQPAAIMVKCRGLLCAVRGYGSCALHAVPVGVRSSSHSRVIRPKDMAGSGRSNG